MIIFGMDEITTIQLEPKLIQFFTEQILPQFAVTINSLSFPGDLHYMAPDQHQTELIINNTAARLYGADYVTHEELVVWRRDFAFHHSVPEGHVRTCTLRLGPSGYIACARPNEVPKYVPKDPYFSSWGDQGVGPQSLVRYVPVITDRYALFTLADD